MPQLLSEKMQKIYQGSEPWDIPIGKGKFSYYVAVNSIMLPYHISTPIPIY